MNRWLAFCQTNLKLVFALVGIVLAFGLFSASKLRFDGDLSRLLPESARSVKDLETLKVNYRAQVGRVTVILTGKSQPKTQALADALVKPLREIDGVARVEVVDPLSELKQHRLLYLNYDDVKTIAKRMKKRIRWERQRANPLFASLTNKPPSIDMSDVEKKYNNNERTYYQSDKGEVLVFVHPSFSANDLNRSVTLIDEVRKTVKQTSDAKQWDGDFSLTGRYQKRIEQQELIKADMGKATSIALLCLLGFLLLYFRSIGAMARVIVPLIVGTIVSLGVAYWIFGSLNILTGFLGAILLGLGVDYGIHLVSRLAELREREDVMTALQHTFGSTGKANLFAGATTMIALGSLTLSKFRAFYEFGIIAVVGVSSILLAYAIILPLWVFAVDKKPFQPRSKVLSVRMGEWLAARMGQRAWSAAVVVCVVILVGAVGAAFGIQHVYMDQSFDSLIIRDAPSRALDRRVNTILGRSQTPGVVLAEDAKHALAVRDELLRRQKEDPRGYAIDKVLTAQDLLPKKQTEKLKVWQDVQAAIDKVPERARSQELVDFTKELQGILKQGSLQLKDLPINLRTPFLRNDRDDASIVLIFPAVELSKAKPLTDFSLVMRKLPGAAQTPESDAQGVADSQLLVDILTLVRRDVVWMVTVTMIGIILMSLLAFGVRRQSWILLATLTLAISAGLGALGWMGQSINFINALVFPVWLGLAVDASFHMLMGERDHGESLSVLFATLFSVAAAFLTSMIGFGALAFARHQGLASLAVVALVGLSIILLIEGAAMMIVLWGRHRPSGSADHVE